MKMDGQKTTFLLGLLSGRCHASSQEDIVYANQILIPTGADLRICYMAFLAHAFNSDRPIRLADWFKEIGATAE